MFFFILCFSLYYYQYKTNRCSNGLTYFKITITTNQKQTTESQKTKIREHFKNETLKFEDEKTNCCFVLAEKKSLNLVLFKSWFDSAVAWEFEGMQVNIPAGWREWLKLRYGDYMRLPISELQGSKISDFVTLNPYKAYTYYKGKTYCI